MSLLYAAYGCNLHPLRLTARDAANRSLIERLREESWQAYFSKKVSQKRCQVYFPRLFSPGD